MTPADSYLTSDKRQVLLTAQEHLLNDRFESAHASLDSLIDGDSSDPIGYLYKAAVYLGQMTDAEQELHTEEFKRLINDVFALAADRIDSTRAREAAWMKLCEGHAHAYRSLWESRFGSFTSALKHAFRGKSSYEDGLRLDSTLYDLYGGLGMYHYWKSAKAGILRWIGVFKNDKEKGIEELYLAADSSSLSHDIARNALIWIWLDMGRYDSVITACREQLALFPDGKLFLWPLARAYFEKKQYHLAAETYTSLRTRLAKSPGNYFNLVECDYSLNRCYDKLDMDELAIRAAKRVEDYYDSIPDRTKRKQRSKLNFLRRVAKRMP
ncbi:MAG: hypothetical protein JSU74_01405 [Candidatus Zixiibacteriota bacterium]|nr:MAG: hypothetical protein JSU74_01405 [candidate division Zixibacteria bacterium]